MDSDRQYPGCQWGGAVSEYRPDVDTCKTAEVFLSDVVRLASQAAFLEGAVTAWAGIEEIYKEQVDAVLRQFHDRFRMINEHVLEVEATEVSDCPPPPPPTERC